MTSHRSSTHLFRVLVSLFLVTTGCALDGAAPDSEPTSEQVQLDSVFRWASEQRISTWASEMTPALGALNGFVYMVHAGCCDTSLWWGRYDGTSWAGDWQIPNQWSSSPPSLAAFAGSLYVTYTHGTSVLYTIYNPNTNTWSDPSGLAFTSNASPAIAAFGTKLYFVYPDTATAQLQQRTMDTSNNLTLATPLGGQFSFSPVALAVYQGRLYVAHAASGGLVYNSSDGMNWGADLRIPGGLNNANQDSPGTPTLAAFNNVLHLMHKEPTTGDTIWWSELNTTTWTVEQALNELGQPSLAAGATKLVMSHGSSAANHAIFYTTFQ